MLQSINDRNTHRFNGYLLRKMILLVRFLILIISISNITDQKYIGYIYNGSYVSNHGKPIVMYKNTCSECICDGFFSSVPPLYVGLNCYKNKTCVLFANCSLTSRIEVNLNSIFIFVRKPPSQNTLSKKRCKY